MTNLLFSTFIYFNSIGLSETKIDYGARLEYQLKPKYSIGIQINNHANDSVVDGGDIYGTRTIYTHGKWTNKLRIGAGKNIEDNRPRISLSFVSERNIGSHFLAQASIGYQREYGSWKGERKPNSMVTQVGLGWRF